MKKVLFVFGSGGHATQSLRLFIEMKDRFDFEFMIEKDDPFTAPKLEGYNIYQVESMRGKKENVFSTLFRAVVCTLQSVMVFSKSYPDIIISAGPGLAIPISYLGKFFGKKIIFIESWSRVTTKSISGKIIYPIADEFYIQWPDMQKVYPKSIYKGRL